MIMTEVNMNLFDSGKAYDRIGRGIPEEIRQRLNGGPKGTRITITDDDGNVLGVYHNKVTISGAQAVACKMWNVDAEINFPNYNEELGLDNTDDYETVQPKNEPYICLFGIGQGGCGATTGEIYPVRYTERIEPRDLLPFRYVDIDDDLGPDQREQYFGRATDEGIGKIKYYFKAFDTEPQLHLRYLDGTQITHDLYAIDSSQAAECYIETRLRITRQDFRDYFEQVLGWENARINSLSLYYAWFDDEIDDYRWYQQILTYSKLNYDNIWLTDLNKAVNFNYQVFY